MRIIEAAPGNNLAGLTANTVDEYFKEMWRRWRSGDARVTRFEQWPNAQPANCHENVDAYVRVHPGSKVIHGAIVQPIGGSERCHFFAHSIVALPTGEWIDITPLADTPESDAQQRECLRFLEHLGSDEQFRLFRDEIRTRIWPPIDATELEQHLGSDDGPMPWDF